MTWPPVWWVLQQLKRGWFKPSEASAKRLFIQQLILSLPEGRSAVSSKDAEEASDFEAIAELAGVSEPIQSDKYDHEKLRLLYTEEKWVSLVIECATSNVLSDNKDGANVVLDKISCGIWVSFRDFNFKFSNLNFVAFNFAVPKLTSNFSKSL
jgi:hypothetical protein